MWRGPLRNEECAQSRNELLTVRGVSRRSAIERLLSSVSAPQVLVSLI